MTALTQTVHITGRHLRAFLRQPWFVGHRLAQPVIWLLLFGALFSSVTDDPRLHDDGSATSTTSCPACSS